MRQKIFDWKSWYSPPPPHVLTINFFATGNFLKHSPEGSLYEIFRHCETKKFRGKLFIPPPPFIHKLFGHRKKDGTHHRRVPLRIISVLWDKKLPTETLDTPPPPIYKLSGYRKFSETQHRRVPLRNFSALSDKKFSTEPLDTHPPRLNHKLFRYRKFSETQYRSVHLRKFSALWDEKHSTETIETPFSSINFLASGNFPKHSTDVFLYEIFRHC